MTKVLEGHRQNKTIGNSLEAKVVLYAEGEALEILKSVEKDLSTLIIVSQVEVHEGAAGGEEATGRNDLKVTVKPADGHKCERCWTYSESVGKNEAHPDLCDRCAGVVE